MKYELTKPNISFNASGMTLIVIVNLAVPQLISAALIRALGACPSPQYPKTSKILMLIMEIRRDVMPNPSIEKEIISQLSKLPLEKQEQVLHFVRTLTLAKPIGIPGKDLLRFAGTIEPSDLQVMAQVIKEDCEQVNLNEW